ncbi:MAG: hypothetical protein RLZZ262_2506, partial [Bacteroidota bacterium]
MKITAYILLQISCTVLLVHNGFGQFLGTSIVEESDWLSITSQITVDYDSDGDLDILQLQRDHQYNAICILQVNDGSGHFTELELDTYDEPYMQEYWNRAKEMRVVDLGNDQVLPVVVKNGSLYFFAQNIYASYISSLLSPDSNYGLSSEDYSVEIQAGYDCLYDFDDDGDLDVAIVELATGDKKWLVNEGQLLQLWGSDSNTLVDRDELVFEGTMDMDDDGLLDAVGIEPTTSQFVWRKQLSNGTFGPVQVLIHDLALTGEIEWMLKDMTGDGILDFVASSDDIKVYFSKGLSSNSFEALQVWDNSMLEVESNNVLMINAILELLPTDYDQDGDLDLLSWPKFYYGFDEPPALFLNNGNGTFADPMDAVLDFGFNNVAIADFDSDGQLDLCNAADARAITTQFIVQFDVETNLDATLHGYGEYYPATDMRPFDYDMDGVMDLACQPYDSFYRNSYPYLMIMNAFTESPGPVITTTEDFSQFIRVNFDPTIENECIRPVPNTGGFWRSFAYGILNENHEFVELERHERPMQPSINWGINDLNNDGIEEYWNTRYEFINPDYTFQGYTQNVILTIVSLYAEYTEHEVLIPSFRQFHYGPYDFDGDGFMEFYAIGSEGESTMFMECNSDFDWSEPQVFMNIPLLVGGMIEDHANGDHYAWGAPYYFIDEFNFFPDYGEIMFGHLDAEGQVLEVQMAENPLHTMGINIDTDNNDIADLITKSALGESIYLENGLLKQSSYEVLEGYEHGYSSWFVGDLNGDNKEDFGFYGYLTSKTWINTMGYGCTDPMACNYDNSLEHMASLCCYGACGCTDQSAINYDPDATCDNGSCQLGVTGRVFHDVNGNGVFDNGDYGLAFQTVSTDDGASTYITNEDGYFTAITGNNSVVLMHIADPNFPYYSTSSYYQTNLANGLNVDFGLSIEEPLSNIDVALYRDWYLCDDDVTFYISYRNRGNTILNGQVEFTYDPLITGHQAISPITSESGTALIFDFENLMPGQMQMKMVSLHTPDFTFMGELMD